MYHNQRHCPIFIIISADLGSDSDIIDFDNNVIYFPSDVTNFYSYVIDVDSNVINLNM